MKILGISCFYHDSAACLIDDGVIVAAAQEERFTRVKHDQRFPELAIRYCLAEAGDGNGSIDVVAFYDKPILKFHRILETHLCVAPAGLKPFMKAMPVWLKEKLWIEPEIGSRLRDCGIDAPEEVYFPNTTNLTQPAPSSLRPSPRPAS